MTATITIYLGTLHESALIGVAAEDLSEAEKILEEKTDDYIEYLRSQLEGVVLEVEPGSHTYSVQVTADSYAEEEDARNRYYSVSDFWSWYA